MGLIITHVGQLLRDIAKIYNKISFFEILVFMYSALYANDLQCHIIRVTLNKKTDIRLFKGTEVVPISRNLPKLVLNKYSYILLLLVI